jgi:HSP20 family protein
VNGREFCPVSLVLDKEYLVMKSLVPWRKKRNDLSNGGDFAPFADLTFSLSRMREEFDRMFDRVSRNFPDLSELDRGWRWGLEMDDNEDTIVVRAEAPGFEAGDFDIRVDDGRLVLRASKKMESKDEKGKVQEYREQECFESVTLPAGIDKEKVDAKYHNGMLTVVLPKAAESKAKRITVKAS